MNGDFVTVVNCMDGRVQEQVREYVFNVFDKKHIDTITLAGPCKVISENRKTAIVKNLKFRIDISVNKHGSNYIYIVGHSDCAGITRCDDTQKDYLIDSVAKLKEWYPNTTIQALWIDSNFKINKFDGGKNNE